MQFLYSSFTTIEQKRQYGAVKRTEPGKCLESVGVWVRISFVEDRIRIHDSGERLYPRFREAILAGKYNTPRNDRAGTVSGYN